MNDTLRERIAEALWNAAWTQNNEEEEAVVKWGSVKESARPYWLMQADAALSVLHEAGEQGDRPDLHVVEDSFAGLTGLARRLLDKRYVFVTGSTPDSDPGVRFVDHLRQALDAVESSPARAGEQESDQ